MNEIRIYDEIGGWGVYAKDIAQQLEASDGKAVTVRINSPGGSVTEGFAIYNVLKDSAANVTTIVDGIAASAASLILLAGDTRLVHEASIVMVHQPWIYTAGNAGELRETADNLDVFNEAMMAAYKKETDIDDETLSELFEKDTYMTGQDAIDYGFATGFIETTSQPNQMAAGTAWANIIAAITKGEHMSVTNKVKAAYEERDELKVTLEAQSAELETAKASVEAYAKQVEEIKAQMETAKAEMQAKIDEQTASLASEVEAKEAALAELATANEDLEKAKAALDNPAMVDAAMIPSIESLIVDDAEADTEAPAVVSLWDQYEEIKDPAARTKFWNENESGLKAEMKG